MHEVRWDSHRVNPKSDAVLVAGLARGCHAKSCSSSCRDTSSVVSEGTRSDERQGFSSSCVLPCCRMTGRSSLSRFTSHPLSCLFGAQTFFATGTAQWETVPTLVGSSFSGSCRYYHKANSSTPALEAVLLLTSPDQISGQTWGWR